MCEMGDLIGSQRAAAAGVIGPAEHPRLEEGAIDDQLTTALEKIEQANFALRSVELVRLLYSHPGHATTLGGQGVACSSQLLFFHQQLLSCSLPLLRRHDRRCVSREKSVVISTLIVLFHSYTPFY